MPKLKNLYKCFGHFRCIEINTDEKPWSTLFLRKAMTEKSRFRYVEEKNRARGGKSRWIRMEFLCGLIRTVLSSSVLKWTEKLLQTLPFIKKLTKIRRWTSSSIHKKTYVLLWLNYLLQKKTRLKRWCDNLFVCEEMLVQIVGLEGCQQARGPEMAQVQGEGAGHGETVVQPRFAPHRVSVPKHGLLQWLKHTAPHALSCSFKTKQPISKLEIQPIFKTEQNSRFWKRDKIADFWNGTKQPIFEMGQNSRFLTKYPINFSHVK